MKIKTIDVHELKNRMNNKPNLCLIDVREHHEWEEIRIPNATHMPKDNISSLITQQIPDKQEEIYLHCKGGVRSLYAAQALIDMGYQEVYSIDGGIMEWASSGYQVER